MSPRTAIPPYRPTVITEIRHRRIPRDRHAEPVDRPLLGVREHHAACHYGGETQARGRGAHGVPSLSRTELGVDIARAGLCHEALEKGSILREHEQSIAVRGKLPRKGKPSFPLSPLSLPPLPLPPSPFPSFPVDRGDCPAERGPTTLVHCQRHRLLVAGYEMGTEERDDPPRERRLLELHGSVHAVGVGEGERPVSSRLRGIEQCARARDSLAEGEMGVDVEVGEQWSGVQG